jgi:protocatechuate 3,4-dioxygenase, beta subunit
MTLSTKIIGLLSISILMISCKKESVTKEIGQTKTTAEVNDSSCDNPDADIECCFVNMPKQLTSVMIISDDDSNSEKLIISGTVYKKNKNTPYPDVIIYAYHTDTQGLYSKKGNETGVQKWHGSHHGWCKTDKNGNYRIETIRPASYPKSTAPAHIHSAIKVPDNATPFYITDFLFKDDPYLPKTQQNKFSYQGGSGVVDVKKINNQWVGKRDIVLN